MNRTDKRFIKTEKLIQSTFYELLEEIGIRKVTIKKICDRAQISRKTFYFHYETLDDFCRKMVEQLFPQKTVMFISLVYQKSLEQTEHFDLDQEMKYCEFRAIETLQAHRKEVDILTDRKNNSWFVQMIRELVAADTPGFNNPRRAETSPVRQSCRKLEFDMLQEATLMCLQWVIEHLDAPKEDLVEAIHPVSTHLFYHFSLLLNSREEPQ